MPKLRWCSLLAVAILLSAGAASAAFWDQGLTNGAVRTEYGPAMFDTNYGTLSDPLQLDDCLLEPDCQTDFPQANAYSDWGGSTAANYWVVIMNNEPWHVAGYGPGVGPPDASLPIHLPSANEVAGLKVRPGSQTVRLALDHRHTNPHSFGHGAIPFLAFGVDRDRGNGGDPILPMDNDPGFLRGISWNMKIEAANDGFCTSAAPNHVNWAAIQAFSEWAGTKRAFYITLYADGLTRSDEDENGLTCADEPSPWNPGGAGPELVDFDTKKNGLWDWPIQRSLYHPGAQFYVLEAQWVTDNCSGVTITRHPGPGTTQSYFLDVEKVFRSLNWSDPMPSSAPLTGFWWVAELTGQASRMQYTVTNPRSVNSFIGGGF